MHREQCLSLECLVSASDREVPLTGPYAEDPVPGWRWDQRLLEDEKTPRARYEHRLPGQTTGLRDGTRQEQWISGSISGLGYRRLRGERSVEAASTFTPEVDPGEYGLFFEARPLYSDRALSARMEQVGPEGVTGIDLEEDADPDTVTVRMMERDAELLRRTWRRWERTDRFTGKLAEAGEARQDPEADDSLDPDRMCDRRLEFSIRNQRVLLNGIHSHRVGPDPVPESLELLEALCEDAGHGNPEGRDHFTRYYPVVPESVSVRVVDEDGTIRTLSRVSRLWWSQETDLHFSADADLGIFTLPGYQAPDLILAEEITSAQDSVLCWPDPAALASYPPEGLIRIGTEIIRYRERGLRGFHRCERGYSGTLAVTHVQGSSVGDVQHGVSIPESSRIFVAYTAVPRIEYEVGEAGPRTANVSGWLDLRPVANMEARGAVQISPVEPHLDRIELEIDRPVIAADLHGPIYFGTDTPRLTATAYDSRDNPVPDIELDIELLSGPGGLNGSRTTVSGTTNSQGQFSALFNAPYDWNSVSHWVTVSHSGPDTLLELDSPLPAGLEGEDLTLFQVLKQDPTFGTVGVKVEALAGSNGLILPEQAPATLEVSGYWPYPGDRFAGGQVIMVFADSTRMTRGIRNAQTLFGVDGHPSSTLLLLDEEVSLLDSELPVDVWVLDREAISWDPGTLNGVRVLVYEWSDEVQHPVTGAQGAYAPLRVEMVDSTWLRIPDRLLPLPAPEDDNSNLGGYLVVASGLSKFQAAGVDPVSGRQVRSNSLRVRIDLPPSLQGVKQDGALPVPRGFRFVTDDDNVGAGIGGANFITINPSSSSLSIRMRIA